MSVVAKLRTVIKTAKDTWAGKDRFDETFDFSTCELFVDLLEAVQGHIAHERAFAVAAIHEHLEGKL